jgi:hypothetical protein
MVIVLGLNIAFYWVRSTNSQRRHLASVQGSGRNERSTPRSFILPATPAVALEQEMRSADDSAADMTRRQIAICATRLLDMGYDVGDEAVSFNAKLSQAIYEYQRAQGLNKTGKLDPETIRSLSCEVK